MDQNIDRSKIDIHHNRYYEFEDGVWVSRSSWNLIDMVPFHIYKETAFQIVFYAFYYVYCDSSKVAMFKHLLFWLKCYELGYIDVGEEGWRRNVTTLGDNFGMLVTDLTETSPT